MLMNPKSKRCNICEGLIIAGACKCSKPSAPEYQPSRDQLYIILQGHNAETLREMVNHFIAKGYIVIGPAQFRFEYGGDNPIERWHQTLVHKSISAQVYA